MIVVVDSRSGYGRQFAGKLGLPVQEISEPVTEPCLLITRNVGLGKIPPSTLAFLATSQAFVRGVVVNGMKRYGPFYCKAGDKIAKEYQLPLVAKIELAGLPKDVVRVKAWLSKQPD